MFLGVIPARGGSKGIPGKNIKKIGGKPLIAWSIESAKQSKQLDDFLVSTDDEEIAAVARAYGAPVMMRPAELATDEATTISVLKNIAEKRPEAEHLIVLQPTSPLRAPALIDECIASYLSDDYDNLATGWYCKYREFGTHNNGRRQDYQGFFYDDGNVYILKRSLALAEQWFGTRINKKVIPKIYNFEIDDEVDILILEKLLSYKQQGKL
ncbi:acylneuraminate cytidylyltransferase family protein [Deltaproteobacteria bacterium TL4]